MRFIFLIAFTVMILVAFCVAVTMPANDTPRDRPAQRTERPDRDTSGTLTHVGPRLRFDGKMHLLPSLTPGIGF